MRVIEHLVKTLRDSAIFNPEVQVTPSCILWPDKDRQWEAVIPRLQSELAELLVLEPGFTRAAFFQRFPGQPGERTTRYADALCAAGLPAGTASEAF